MSTASVSIWRRPWAEEGDFDPFSAFFDLVAQDPVVSQVKLIAEPWDVGRMDSYDIGRFPPLWSEWNGRFRDTVRDWWRSHDGLLRDFASRLCASADIYGGPTRGAGPARRSTSSPSTTASPSPIWCPTTQAQRGQR